MNCCCASSSWPCHHRCCAGVLNDMKCSALWEIKPTQQVHLKELISRQVSCVRPCQTVTLVFSWCAVLLEQDFMESIQNAYQCNVGKCFMCGWTWMWGDNINPKLWQKLILMSFLFLLALTCFYKYCVVEWIPDWWMWKPAYQCLKGKAFKYK